LFNYKIIQFLIFALLPFIAVAEENLEKNSRIPSPIVVQKPIIGAQIKNIPSQKTISPVDSLLNNNFATQKTETKTKAKVGVKVEVKPKHISPPALPKVNKLSSAIVNNNTNTILQNSANKKKEENSQIIDKNKPKFLLSNTSLMSEERELGKINGALEAFKIGVPLKEPVQISKSANKQKKVEEDNNSYLKLSTMLFFSKTNWTIWLNDKKINSKKNEKNNEIYISQISNQKIDIIWKMNLTKWKFLAKKNKNIPKTNKNNEVILNFSLKPQQTYMIAENKVVSSMENNTKSNEFKPVSDY
jgi:hypothetical protein